MASRTTVKAIEKAANDSVAYHAELHSDAVAKARKRRKIRKKAAAAPPPPRDLNDYDQISVPSFERSLMHSVRTLGVQYVSKKLRTLTTIDKYYARLALNSIVDLNDKQYMSLLNINTSATNNLLQRFAPSDMVTPPANDTLMKLYDSLNDDARAHHIYKHFTINQFKHSGDDKLRILILANIYKIINQNNGILSNWKTSSETTIIIKLWAHIFETLFEDSMAELVWGETKHDEMKIDLRVCLRHDGKLYDLSNVEFKKNGNNHGLIKADGAKVIIEGKSIFNRLCEIYNMDYNEAKGKMVIIGQVCGLKMIFNTVRLAAPGCYMPFKYCHTIKYPHNVNKAKLFAKGDLEWLFSFKDYILNEATALKQELQKDESNFGSQSTAQDLDYLNQLYIIQDRSIKWLAINDDYYK